MHEYVGFDRGAAIPRRREAELGHHEAADREGRVVLFSRDVYARHSHRVLRLQRGLCAETVFRRGAAIEPRHRQHQGAPGGKLQVLRGAVVNRTYGTHKKNYLFPYF